MDENTANAAAAAAQPTTQRIEMTSPGWRVASVIFIAGAFAAIGFWLRDTNFLDAFSTVLVISIAFTISFWAKKRPDQLEMRFGPFGKIAGAIRESQSDVQEWVYNKPLRTGFILAVGYGIATVAAKTIVVTVLRSMASPWLAVALGAAIGAVVAAPQLFTAIWKHTKLPTVAAPVPVAAPAD